MFKGKKKQNICKNAFFLKKLRKLSKINNTFKLKALRKIQNIEKLPISFRHNLYEFNF